MGLSPDFLPEYCEAIRSSGATSTTNHERRKLEAQHMLIDARLFVVPIGDPMPLVLDGFEDLPARRDRTERPRESPAVSSKS